MAAPKDIVYIDLDEEITGIIEKVRTSKEKIVALVLPKRAPVLQSIVNMKLLKRSADEVQKHIVLITADANLLPLAGAVGFYCAKTLQTRPVVPPAPPTDDDLPESVTEEANIGDEAVIDPSKPIGALAGMPEAADDEIELSALEHSNNEALAAVGTAALMPKKPFNKKLKVPNFERFRTALILGVLLLIILLGGVYYAATALPKAAITIKTNTSSVSSDITFTASTTAQTVDLINMIIPATVKQAAKSGNQIANTTGTKDEGVKASGSVTFSTSCGPTTPTIPAGTQVSAGQYIFITQTDASLNKPTIDGSGRCTFNGTATVLAQSAGDQYNLSARSYNVSGYSAVSAQGSNMSGGISKIVKIVAAADIEGAKQKFLDANSAAATAELKQQFVSDKGIPFNETFAAGDPKIIASANVGDPAEQVTVTVDITYTMIGITKMNLAELINSDLKKHIDIGKQQISNNGAERATIKVLDRAKPTALRIESQTTATAGAEQNSAAIQQLVSGMKSGDAKTAIQSRPGIQEATVKLSPFWVTHVPKKPAKVNVTFISTNGK
ncbi:MAG: hypothetical protein NVS1B7_8140 [Candidatus Saccharimonadales bacterium]